MTRSRTLLVSFLCLVLVTGCASRTAGWFSKKNKVELSKSEFKQLKNKTMQQWSQRHDKEQLKLALGGLETLANATEENLEFYTLLSRGYYLLADGHTDDMDQKLKTWEKGTSFGEKAMATNKAFAAAMQDGEKVSDHLDKLGEKESAAIYWTAVNLGKWAKNSGITTILKYKSQIKKMIYKVEEYDPNYFFGSPLRYWGAYYAVAPSFAGGDINKSKEYFDKVMKKFPGYLGSKVLYADLYTTKKGDKSAFKKTLTSVINAKPKRNEYYPENVIEQKKAKKILKLIDEKF